MDDSEIKEGDWMWREKDGIVFVTSNFFWDFGVPYKKITHSTEPLELLSENGLSGMGFSKVRPLNVFEVKELIGEVDVEKKVMKLYNNFKLLPLEAMYQLEGATKRFVESVYNQALEDNKEKKYTEKEVFDLMCKAFEQGFKKADVVDAGLESKETDVECDWILKVYKRPKTEWNVEFIDGKIKLI